MTDRPRPRCTTFLLAVCSLLTARVAGAESVVYQGEGHSQGQEMVMNLSNGDKVVVARSDGEATLDTEPQIVFDTVCFAMGLVGDQHKSRSDFYCTFREKEGESTLDLKGSDTGDGARAMVVGGSGRWSGISGEIRFNGQRNSETGKSYRYVLTVNRP
ncbi:MAG: hypothetical protein LJE91_18320 [Gammaproteobacteria bacterium]|nr:hypothetical protein [Gammaproteobacteria bacterium]